MTDLTSQQELDGYLAAVLTRYIGTDMDLSALSRRARGAYPLDVARVQRLSVPVLPASGAPPMRLEELAVSRSRLPVPHPLDYEWRFSRRGCETLRDLMLRELNGRTSKTLQVALLGTSGLAEVLPGLAPGVSICLFERRTEACDALVDIEGLTIVAGDVSSTHDDFRDQFDVVIADPPWYPKVARLFIGASAQILRRGGYLLMCCPGLATRPGVIIERVDLAREAGQYGLSVEEQRAGIVGYESPPFELAALEAAGLPNFDPLWRRGDVLGFRLGVRAPWRDVSLDGNDTSGQTWVEIEVGRARFRINFAERCSDGCLLDEHVPGAVLDSVSSRDPRRAGASVWTTTNRVYRSGDPVAVYDELSRAAVGDGCDSELGRRVRAMLSVELECLERIGVQ